ncbi:MAG: FecR domain-containing protein [Planctomycetes bacterium]|nr:FecR domain-containing protein [Planctomycetota bacterium]
MSGGKRYSGRFASGGSSRRSKVVKPGSRRLRKITKNSGSGSNALYYLMAFLICSLFVGSLLFLFYIDAEIDRFQVQEIQGTAYIQRGVDRELLSVNDQLSDDSEIFTSRKGKISLKYNDEPVTVGLSGRAKFLKADKDGQKQIYLVQGQLQSDIHKDNKGMKVTTDTHEMLAKDGRFRVAHFNNNTRLFVERGQILFKPREEQSYKVVDRSTVASVAQKPPAQRAAQPKGRAGGQPRAAANNKLPRAQVSKEGLGGHFPPTVICGGRMPDVEIDMKGDVHVVCARGAGGNGSPMVLIFYTRYNNQKKEWSELQEVGYVDYSWDNVAESPPQIKVSPKGDAYILCLGHLFYLNSHKWQKKTIAQGSQDYVRFDRRLEQEFLYCVADRSHDVNVRILGQYGGAGVLKELGSAFSWPEPGGVFSSPTIFFGNGGDVHLMARHQSGQNNTHYAMSVDYGKSWVTQGGISDSIRPGFSGVASAESDEIYYADGDGRIFLRNKYDSNLKNINFSPDSIQKNVRMAMGKNDSLYAVAVGGRCGVYSAGRWRKGDDVIDRGAYYGIGLASIASSPDRSSAHIVYCGFKEKNGNGVSRADILIVTLKSDGKLVEKKR